MRLPAPMLLFAAGAAANQVVELAPGLTLVRAVRLTPPAPERGVRIAADIAFGEHDLREWVEALVEVG